VPHELKDRRVTKKTKTMTNAALKLDRAVSAANNDTNAERKNLKVNTCKVFT